MRLLSKALQSATLSLTLWCDATDASYGAMALIKPNWFCSLLPLTQLLKKLNEPWRASSNANIKAFSPRCYFSSKLSLAGRHTEALGNVRGVHE